MAEIVVDGYTRVAYVPLLPDPVLDWARGLVVMTYAPPPECRCRRMHQAYRRRSLARRRRG